MRSGPETEAALCLDGIALAGLPDAVALRCLDLALTR